MEALESLLHTLIVVEVLVGGLSCSELSERIITVGDENDDRNRHC